MKFLSTLFITILLISCSDDNLKLIDEDEFVRRMIANELPELTEIRLLNSDGHEISPDSLITLEKTRKYFEEIYVNHEGEIVQIIIRPKTPEDQAYLDRIDALMKQHKDEGQPLETVVINCADKVSILQNVFDRDQEMRRGESTIDPKIDHANLEIIVSFIEQCGMPTLDEVIDVQMAGIWAVLQHAPAKYQSKYIPLLEESAKKGDIKWSIISLMKDRALMYEGKPQIYGSQVSNGELYDLHEPEYVDQRREALGMEPLSEYLKRFDIIFEVEQKQK